MKTKLTSHWITALLLAAPLASAQEPVKIAETPYEVIERGPHERVWQREIQWQEPDGRLTTETNSYIETHSGMHYWDGEWKESQELIEVFEQGAVARHGQTKVIFSPAIDDPEGSVIIETPDGKTLRTGILALNYVDPVSGEQVTLGIVQESYAELLPPNRIIYPSAFDGVKADVIYTYTKTGLTQDILLLERPPAPELLGLSAESRLEIMTEVFEGPKPEKRVSVLRREEDPVKRARMVAPDVTDEELWFGELVIAEGRAFWQNSEPGEEPELGEGVAVAKRWYEAPDGRRVLIESAGHLELEPLMEELPEFGEEEARVMPEKRPGMGPHIPERQIAAVREEKPVMLALAGAYPKAGLNLDYTSMLGNHTNHVWRGNETWLITGIVNLYGETVLEGAAILKFDKYDAGSGVYPRVYVRGPFRCETSDFAPAILTARDDSTVGQSIATGTLDGYYAHYALWFYDTSSPILLENVQIRHAYYGAMFYKNTSNAIRHAQIVNSRYSVYTSTATLDAHNLLIDGALNYGLFLSGSSAHIRGEHLTVHDAANLRYLGSGSTLSLTNSLLVDINSIGSFTGSHNFTNSSYSATFEPVGAGHFYLKSVSPYRDAGTAAIDPELLQAIRRRTTSPPIILTDSITTPTTLAPQAQRDTDIPDAGYHYAPIDWAVGDLPVSHTLTLTNGVVITAIANKGFILNSGAKIISEGTPTDLNRLIRHQSVQEQSDFWNMTYHWRWLLASQATTPEVDLRFTEVVLMPPAGPPTAHFLSGSLSRLNIRDSQFRNVLVHGIPSTWIPMLVGMTNNLFHGCGLSFSQYYTSGLDADFYNNLFVRGSVSLLASQPAYFTWTVKDNVFDNSSVTDNSYSVQNSHNGYVNTSVGLSGGSSNVEVPTFDYGEGPLGRFYQVSTNFTDKGSQSASAAGLYHHTTRLSQVKEDTSQVDIGYHFMAAGPDTAGMVGYWPLDEGAGTMAGDASGGNHNGTLLNGPVWISGNTGPGALGFDGVNDYVSVPDATALRLGTTMTIAFWYRKDAEKSDWVRLVGKGDSYYRNYGVWEEAGSGKRILFQCYPATGASISLYSTVNLEIGLWYHVACTYDGSRARIYINGVAAGEQTVACTPRTSTHPLTFAYAGFHTYGAGALDDIRLYSRALDGGEIQSFAASTIDLRDADGDGLADYFEDANGNGTTDTGETSNTNKDTDGDGLSDHGEVMTYGSDPTDAHTFNGVADDSEFLFSATGHMGSGSCTCNTLAHLHIDFPSNNLYPMTISQAPAGALYDLYFVNDIGAEKWQWRRVFSGIECDASGAASFTIAGPDPSQAFFVILSAEDEDGDGLSDGYECWFTYNGQRTLVDNVLTDFDLMRDDWEVEYGINPTKPLGPNPPLDDPDGDNGNPDLDSDGAGLLTNEREHEMYSAPLGSFDPLKDFDTPADNRPMVWVFNPTTVFNPPATEICEEASFVIQRFGGDFSNPLTVY
ncbi:MAG TPA: LamG-like jellyroll fold domain-containing protein, partial [Methylomirabilota bacterium]|nr:LamG-like jellyroll fold domain-containing protein [Methylomirabilota bacterium]